MHCIPHKKECLYYLCHHLDIVSVCVSAVWHIISACRVADARRISLGGEGNALCTVLSGFQKWPINESWDCAIHRVFVVHVIVISASLLTDGGCHPASSDIAG